MELWSRLSRTPQGRDTKDQAQISMLRKLLLLLLLWPPARRGRWRRDGASPALPTLPAPLGPRAGGNRSRPALAPAGRRCQSPSHPAPSPFPGPAPARRSRSASAVAMALEREQTVPRERGGMREPHTRRAAGARNPPQCDILLLSPCNHHRVWREPCGRDILLLPSALHQSSPVPRRTRVFP